MVARTDTSIPVGQVFNVTGLLDSLQHLAHILLRTRSDMCDTHQRGNDRCDTHTKERQL
jgi:hypothetical protein